MLYHENGMNKQAEKFMAVSLSFAEKASAESIAARGLDITQCRQQYTELLASA